MAAAADNGSSLDFEEGDPIVHPHHGGGEIVEIRRWAIADQERNYYCIELVNEDSTLMIPVAKAAEMGLRAAIHDLAPIEAILAAAPAALDNDYRKRQSTVAGKIKDGHAESLAEVIRDLAWREQSGDCTGRDLKLKAQAEDLLVSEIMLVPEIDGREAAVIWIGDRVQQNIDQQLSGDGSA
jgi:CarD family transcriptional regulator